VHRIAAPTAPAQPRVTTAAIGECPEAVSRKDIHPVSCAGLPIAFAPAYAAVSSESMAARQAAPQSYLFLETSMAAEKASHGPAPTPWKLPIAPPPGLSLDHMPAVRPPPGLAAPAVGPADSTAKPQPCRGKDVESEWPPMTTSVMLRNIPNRYTPEELLHDMVQRGFEGAFDFFYLPTDFATKKNKGYGFINLRTPSLALRFRHVFDGQKLTRYVTQKVLEVSPAVTQGLAANACKYLKYQAGRVQNPWFKPMIFVPPEDGPEVGARAAPWQCLPLTEENLPGPLRSHVAALAAMQHRGGNGSGRVQGGPHPIDTPPSAHSSSDCGDASSLQDADADVSTAADLSGCEASSEDVDAAALMQAAVDKFLRSCRDEVDSALSGSPGQKTRGGRRRGGRARKCCDAQLVAT